MGSSKIHRSRWVRFVAAAVTALAAGACAGGDYEDEDFEADADDAGEYDRAGVSCDPQMSVFPVAAAHNIGYDEGSCGTGTCAVSCPDVHANSDWGSGHHGIDVFAHYRAPLVSTVDGEVVAMSWPSETSGLRVRVRDACGWEYYYGHLDEAVVKKGDHVSAGQLLGYMGNTGTSGVHLHFNVSPDGNYSDDIDPIDLLVKTSPTACGAAPPPPAPAPPPPAAPGPAGCGVMQAGDALGPDEALTSCDGRFNLVAQGDGNLVLYMGSTPLWHTHTNGKSISAAVMQEDGNFVLYDANGNATWHSHTFGHAGASLSLQDDGNLVVYSGSTPLWNSQTCCH